MKIVLILFLLNLTKAGTNFTKVPIEVKAQSSDLSDNRIRRRSLQGSLDSLLSIASQELIDAAKTSYYKPCHSCEGFYATCAYQTTARESIISRLTVANNKEVFVGQTRYNKHQESFLIFYRPVKDGNAEASKETLYVATDSADWLSPLSLTVGKGEYHLGTLDGSEVLFSTTPCRIFRKENNLILELVIRLRGISCTHRKALDKLFTFESFFEASTTREFPDHHLPVLKYPYGVELRKGDVTLIIAGYPGELTWEFNADRDRPGEFIIPQDCK